MWNGKHPIAPGFDWRLKVALDRITPPPVLPGYAMARPAFKPWRLAPIALAGATIVLLALSATAATGSANPVVWTQRAASTIESVGHAPATSPSPAPSPAESPASAPVAAPTHESASESAPQPEPPERPEDTPRPAAPDEHSSPSATPDDH